MGMYCGGNLLAFNYGCLALVIGRRALRRYLSPHYSFAKLNQIKNIEYSTDVETRTYRIRIGRGGKEKEDNGGYGV